MKILKIYAIKNVTTAVYVFPLGKARFRCVFDKGVINAKITRPATFSTSSEIVQTAIEKSPLFNNRIFLREALEIMADGKKAALPKNSVKTSYSHKSEQIVIEEAESLGDVINILREKGVPAKKLRNVQMIMSTVEELGYSFPNVNFEEKSATESTE